ncbi:hypothetical protein MICRO8M_60275 [Microbacterium sp. 8M]|nr:hypothetical protein MICRO8M_60275 [Microbacterium sp. 8M]
MDGGRPDPRRDRLPDHRHGGSRRLHRRPRRLPRSRARRAQGPRTPVRAEPLSASSS